MEREYKDSSYDNFKGILTEMKLGYLNEEYQKVVNLFDDVLENLDSETLKHSDKFYTVYKSMCRMYALAKEKLGEKKFYMVSGMKK